MVWSNLQTIINKNNKARCREEIVINIKSEEKQKEKKEKRMSFLGHKANS